MRKQGDNAASIPKRPASSPGSRLGACMSRQIPRLAPGGLYESQSLIKAPMRKQGDNAASIPKRPASSPGSRLGAFI